jgi:hypothetical protein
MAHLGRQVALTLTLTTPGGMGTFIFTSQMRKLRSKVPWACSFRLLKSHLSPSILSLFTFFLGPFSVDATECYRWVIYKE